MAPQPIEVDCRDVDDLMGQKREMTLAEADAIVEHYQGCAMCRDHWGKGLAELEQLIDDFLLKP